MLVSGYPHPGEAGAMSTFVWYLTSTPPTALAALDVTHRFVGTPLLLDTAVQASRWHGLGGRTALHADHRGTRKQQDDPGSLANNGAGRDRRARRCRAGAVFR